MSRIAWLGIALWAVACDGASPADGGMTDGGRDGSSTTVCAADEECGDTSLFCSQWRCRPGEDGTDARGCIDLGSPCASGVECDEDEDTCSLSWCTEGREGCLRPGDCDGDGSRHELECGGDDCDDSDPDRFPGNPEVCDAEGHDEDCNLETFAGEADGDLDGDGFISAMCCNGDACGDDCDDGDINVNPAATEVCDGIDNDCSGAADDAPGLCPGGLCVAGRCDFSAWDLTFGDERDDRAFSVAMDAGGSVYVTGAIRDGVDFGGGHRTVAGQALFVAKFAPDGVYQWDYISPPGGIGWAPQVAVSPDGDDVYVVGSANGVNFGSGTSDGLFLLVLDSNGERRTDRRFGSYTDELADVVADEAGVVVTGGFRGIVNWGDGPRTASGFSGVVARYDSSGAWVWDRQFAVPTGSLRTAHGSALALLPDGRIALGGWYGGGELTLGTALPPGTSLGNGFVALLTSSGEPIWAHPLTTSSMGRVRIEAVAADEVGVYAAGSYFNRLTSGTWTSSVAGTNAFVLAVDIDATPRWARSFGSAGADDEAHGVAIDSTGGIVVVGNFSTTADFGRGPRPPCADSSCPAGTASGFLARFSAAGTPRDDVVYNSGGETSVRGAAIGTGDTTAIVGNFTGTANFGSGPRSSNGGVDGFILRLGS